MTTEITYSNNKNPMDLVLIKSDDSFVIVGDHEPSDIMLFALIDYLVVTGYTIN
jgi:hypothetical protein